MLRSLAALALLASTTLAAQTVPAPRPISGTTPKAQPAPGEPADEPRPAATSTLSARERNAQLTAPLPADQAAMKAHVMFLAADALKGREAGSPEYDIAAEYVAAQFYAAGLKPMGDEGGYLQRVPLVAYKAAGEGDFVLSRGTAPQKLVFGTDYIPAAAPSQPKLAVSAPVVFAGYGIVAPQYGRDDFAGADVRGRIVAVVAGAPSGMTPEERAFFGSPARKAAFAGALGAVGVILLSTPEGEKRRPFARSVAGYAGTRMTWANPDGSGHAEPGQAPLLGTLSMAGAAKLFTGSGKQWLATAAALAQPKGKVLAFALPGTLSVATQTTLAPARSSNVVGILPGSDPALAAETVVLSAHLDHIGISDKATNGDTINNGAMDDAIGIASLIEAAKRFKASAPPKRSILFLAVTAEEKGLIGSDYFVNHPTVPAAGIVADVNLDMPILTYVFEDMIAFGGDRSTLGPIIARAVAAIGVTLSPDPMPEEGIFVRSDHFRFVAKGVPSVFLWPGKKGPGGPAVDHFMANNYHKPSDDMSQPILWDQGVRFVDANVRIAREIADAPTRPVWNKGDYFGTLFKGPMAR